MKRKWFVLIQRSVFIELQRQRVRYRQVLDRDATLIREGASDEKEQGIRYMEYLADCLKTGKLEVKWNIS